MVRPRILMIIFLLILIASVLLGIETRYYRDSETGQIQQFLGGLGLGSAIIPEWGFLNYDPRIDFVDETSLWPIPGGYSYSPERGFSITDMGEPIISFFSSVEASEKEPLHIEHPLKNPPTYTDHKRCYNCGMDRNRYARTRYEFDTSKGRIYTCSIHCVAVLSFYKLKEKLRNVKVAEYLRPERMLDADKAFFVIGSIAPGTMTRISKIAFPSRKEAEDFSFKHGGKVVDFITALSEAKKEINHKD